MEQHPLAVEADPDDVLKEGSETNNRWAVTVTVDGQPEPPAGQKVFLSLVSR